MSDALANPELFGLTSAIDGGVLFCGVTEEAFAINGVTYQWPRGSRLTWKLEFSRLGQLSDMDCKDAFTEAFKEISAACDLPIAMAAVGQVPNLSIVTKRLDGQRGVLADCQIPVGNVGPGTTLLMRIDDSESWGLTDNPPNGLIDLYRVGLHEGLHWVGLGHRPPSNDDPALIAPLYNPRMRNLQAADKAELVRRYGPAKQLPPPGPSPGTPPATLPARIEFDAYGRTYIASGNAKLK